MEQRSVGSFPWHAIATVAGPNWCPVQFLWRNRCPGGLGQGFVPHVVIVATLGAPASFSGFPRPWGFYRGPGLPGSTKCFVCVTAAERPLCWPLSWVVGPHPVHGDVDLEGLVDLVVDAGF